MSDPKLKFSEILLLFAQGFVVTFFLSILVSILASLALSLVFFGSVSIEHLAIVLLFAVFIMVVGGGEMAFSLMMQLGSDDWTKYIQAFGGVAAIIVTIVFGPPIIDMLADEQKPECETLFSVEVGQLNFSHETCEE